MANRSRHHKRFAASFRLIRTHLPHCYLMHLASGMLKKVANLKISQTVDPRPKNFFRDTMYALYLLHAAQDRDTTLTLSRSSSQQSHERVLCCHSCLHCHFSNMLFVATRVPFAGTRILLAAQFHWTLSSGQFYHMKKEMVDNYHLRPDIWPMTDCYNCLCIYDKWYRISC